MKSRTLETAIIRAATFCGDLVAFLRRKPYSAEVLTICQTTVDGKFGEKVTGYALNFRLQIEAQILGGLV